MAEVAVTPKAKPAKPTASFEAPKMEMPKFEMPKFDMSSMEVPAAFREFAEKGIEQAKDGYAKMKAAAEDTTGMMETTFTTASKGATDYGQKVIEITKANTATAFDFLGKLLAVKSVSEAVELSSAHAREQYEVGTAQAKELTTLAQKVATEAAEPIKSAMSKVAA